MEKADDGEMAQAEIAREGIQVKPRQVTPSHAKPSHATPSHAKSRQVEPSRAKSSQVESSRAKSSQVEPSRAKSSKSSQVNRVKSSEAESSQSSRVNQVESSQSSHRLPASSQGRAPAMPAYRSTPPARPRVERVPARSTRVVGRATLPSAPPAAMCDGLLCCGWQDTLEGQGVLGEGTRCQVDIVTLRHCRSDRHQRERSDRFRSAQRLAP